MSIITFFTKVCIKDNIFVGNGQYVGVLFVIPVVINLHGHRFEEYTLLSEILNNLGMVMRIKNLYEMKGVLSTTDSYLHFLIQCMLH